ncbi:MAG: transposase family protein [Moorea sp. SIO3C2]|nr:transposase family protein [Moorena sp. SIO3C2]
MVTISGYLGYRALVYFVNRHKEALIETLKLPKKTLPSYSTIRLFLMGIDFDNFVVVFNT